MDQVALVMSKPIVSIIGKPNVGKSTLFNRLIGERKAIVYDTPGVTRDRNYEDTSIYEIDITLVDTGGFDPIEGDPLTDLTRSQVKIAIDESELILFMVDGTQPLSSSDYATLDLLRRSGREFILVVNKIDGKRKEFDASFIYSLGVEDTVFISALHGRGMGNLLDLMYQKVKRLVGEEEEEKEKDRLEMLVDEEEEKKGEEEVFSKVAIIGRPNVGKSTLINRIIGEERLLTSEIPGTTTDPIDVVVEWDQVKYLFIDTAGIRRKKNVKEGIERISVYRAIRAIERADIVVMLLDGVEGPTHQDARLISLSIDRGKGIVVAVNKWDLIEGKEGAEKFMADEIRERFAFAKWLPFCFISAKTGKGIPQLFSLINKVTKERQKRITTGKLNRFFQNIIKTQPPPVYKNKLVKMYYITQAETSPPLFVIFVNEPNGIRESYRRFIANKIRENFGFVGTPIKIVFRGKSKEEVKEEIR